MVWQMWLGKHGWWGVGSEVSWGGLIRVFWQVGVRGWGGQYEFNEFNFTGLRVFGLMVPTTTPTSRVYC